MLNSLPVVCLMGPTATGKTQVALELTERLPCDIISVDSMMVYRDMNIGSAKPDDMTLTRYPHKLVNIREFYEPYSAGSFLRDVTVAIDESLHNNRIPLLVGGTMLYFNVLRQGLADLPRYDYQQDPLGLKAEIEKVALPVLYEQLKKYDPVSARRIHPHDKQRIQRALIVYSLSQVPLSTLHQTQQNSAYPFLWIAIQANNREQLRKNITSRFETMLSTGLIEEVDRLMRHEYFSADLPAFRSIGYRQVLQYLLNQISRDTLPEKGITATYQLAKRQLTWLRSWKDITAFEAGAPNLSKLIQQHIINAQHSS